MYDVKTKWPADFDPEAAGTVSPDNWPVRCGCTVEVWQNHTINR